MRSVLSRCGNTLSNLTAHDQLILAQLVRAVGMPLVIVPLTSLTTTHIGPQQSGSASALYNMFRNLGGSIGIATLATQVDLREEFHSVRLGEAINAFNPAAVERLEALARHFIARGAGTAAATEKALGAVGGVVRREAYVVAYGDCFCSLKAALLNRVGGAEMRPVQNAMPRCSLTAGDGLRDVFLSLRDRLR